MNEKIITDHAEHADFYVGNEHYDKSHEEQQRLWVLKFSELMIEDCIIRAEREWIRNGDTEHNQAISKVIESIKQHFGVEE